VANNLSFSEKFLLDWQFKSVFTSKSLRKMSFTNFALTLVFSALAFTGIFFNIALLSAIAFFVVALMAVAVIAASSYSINEMEKEADIASIPLKDSGDNQYKYKSTHSSGLQFAITIVLSLAVFALSVLAGLSFITSIGFGATLLALISSPITAIVIGVLCLAMAGFGIYSGKRDKIFILYDDKSKIDVIKPKRPIDDNTLDEQYGNRYKGIKRVNHYYCMADSKVRKDSDSKSLNVISELDSKGDGDKLSATAIPLPSPSGK